MKPEDQKVEVLGTGATEESSEAVKDFRLEIKVRNNRILRLMELAGISTVAELCRKAGTRNQAEVGAIINLRKSPLLKSSTPERPDFRKSVKKIAAAMRVPPEVLFSEEQLEMALPTNEAYIQTAWIEAYCRAPLSMDGQRLLGLEEYCDPQERLEREEEVKDLLDAVNYYLTPREKEVLTRRIEDQETLEDIAKTTEISRGRVGQIENKAIRKLRKKLLRNQEFGTTTANQRRLARSRLTRMTQVHQPRGKWGTTSEA